MENKERENKSPGENANATADPTRGIGWAFFGVGVFLLLVTTFLAIVGFAMAPLTPDQRGILIFWFSLAAGFCAGSFLVGLSVETQGWIKGLLISATGGFAVWLLMFFFAAPNLFIPRPVNTLPESSKVLQWQTLDVVRTVDERDKFEGIAEKLRDTTGAELLPSSVYDKLLEIRKEHDYAEANPHFTLFISRELSDQPVPKRIALPSKIPAVLVGFGPSVG